MPKIRQRPAWFLVLTAIVLCAHVTLNAHFSSLSESISYGFFLPLSLLSAGVCGWRASRSVSGIRRNWALFAAAFLVWFAATVIAAREHFFEHASPTAATIDDFFYFFYGVPILLAITAPDDNKPDALLFWSDGIQAAAVGFLSFIAIFAAIPFSGAPLQPMPVSRLIWIYDAENLLLLIFATARWLVSPRNAPQRRYFQILVIFLWTYALCAGIYNHIVSAFLDAGTLDALVDLPFIVLLFVAAFATARAPDEDLGPYRKPVALFIDNARLILLSLSLVLLSIAIAREHFNIAMGTIFGAFVLYGVRAAILQGRVINTQMLLEMANGRLEELTLEDGLTGIANRRCFDQRLALEWNRAHRTHAPLSLLMIDIDHFKKLNDTYGHLVGDECLTQVAHAMRRALNRPGDLIARYGGEEFVVLLPETDELGVRNVAARIQATLRDTEHIQAIDKQVTVSAGATTWKNHSGTSPEQLVDTADRALYNAKQNGRNRVESLPLEANRGAQIKLD